MWVSVLLGGCGQAQNESGSPAGTLCFDYFQRCVYPQALNTPFPVDVNNDGVFESTKSCASGDCHGGSTSGGGLQLTENAATVDLATVTLEELRALGAYPMYRNFIAAKGRADLNNPRQSPLVQKPLVEVDHNGGRVFVDDQDPAVRQMLYWVSNRVPLGGNELSGFCATLFVGGVPGQCQP